MVAFATIATMNFEPCYEELLRYVILIRLTTAMYDETVVVVGLRA